MPHIQLLNSHMSDLIAAGEVVERPASVVKELVENSIDAGSTAITVELRRGGMALIRVTDNGCGISADELPTAFLRHATSKLRTPEDLSQIATLGFRGEALAAIASVSRTEITSRQPGENIGASLRIEGGVFSAVETVGAPEGTTIIVQDLFFNTPARLKFMKKDSAEATAINGLLQHLALSRPDISFTLVKDGAEILHSPGDGKLLSAVYAAQGRDFARTLIPVDGRGGDVQVQGFVTEPVHGRGSRSMQVMFVNQRFIKSQLLTAALEEAYRNQLLKGKFPGCVLSVTLPVTQVDVNVHPAKTSVKFSREQDVFHAVYYTVLDALNHKTPASVPSDSGNSALSDTISETLPPADILSETAVSSGNTVPDVEQIVSSRKDFFQNMTSAAYRDQIQGVKQKPKSFAPKNSSRFGDKQGTFSHPVAVEYDEYEDEEHNNSSDSTDIPGGVFLPENILANRKRLSESTEDRLDGYFAETPLDTTVPFNGLAPKPELSENTQREEYTEFPDSALQNPAIQNTDHQNTITPADHPDHQEPEHLINIQTQTQISPSPATVESPSEAEQTVLEELPKDPPWRIVGEFLRTYIACESSDGNIWLIDKHAAHERINFDRLRNADAPHPAQTLLQPVTMEPAREDWAVLWEHEQELSELGFSIEEFGTGTLLVREVPVDMDAAEIPAALEELAELLRCGKHPDAYREEMLKTIACKAAIKAGWLSEPDELRVLVEKVQSGEVRYCPHGRPVAVRVTARDLEKLFKRT